jgi:hypothetical protein
MHRSFSISLPKIKKLWTHVARLAANLAEEPQSVEEKERALCPVNSFANIF